MKNKKDPGSGNTKIELIISFQAVADLLLTFFNIVLQGMDSPIK